MGVSQGPPLNHQLLLTSNLTWWVFITLLGLYPIVFRLTGVSIKLSRFTKVADTNECVETLSQRTRSFFFFESRNGKWCDRQETYSWLLSNRVSGHIFAHCLSEWRIVFVLLPWWEYFLCSTLLCFHNWFCNFLAFGHFQKLWLPCKQAKQSFCSAICVFFLRYSIRSDFF